MASTALKHTGPQASHKSEEWRESSETAHIHHNPLPNCSYRGYRLNNKLISGGAPNEPGLKQDTQAALDYLLSRQDINPRQVSLLSYMGGQTELQVSLCKCDFESENEMVSVSCLLWLIIRGDMLA